MKPLAPPNPNLPAYAPQETPAPQASEEIARLLCCPDCDQLATRTHTQAGGWLLTCPQGHSFRRNRWDLIAAGIRFRFLPGRM